MLQNHSHVVYGQNGVCKITDIREEKLYGAKQTYYVLTPIDNEAFLIYIPTDNEGLTSKMRPLLSKEEALLLLREIHQTLLPWISDNKERGAFYASLLSRGDHRELLALIHTIHHKRRELSGQRKRLWAVDELALKRAEKLICDEFAIALGIAPDKVPAFISETIQPSD